MVVVYKFSPRFVRKEHLHFTGNFLENVGNRSISGYPLGIPGSVYGLLDYCRRGEGK